MQVLFKKAFAQCFAKHCCSHGRRRRGGCCPLLDFHTVHGTDKEERGLMGLFIGLVFSVASWKFFCRRPWLQ